VLLWISSVTVTAFLSFTNEWSVNTFDGASVALFDVEGYAKPHVRAQSYLAGILVAFWPKRPKRNQSIGHFLGSDAFLMGLSLSCLFTLSFVTVTGAYQRRACTFEELPAYDDCGSLWSPTATFLYTGFSRALWSICIAIIMAICLERKDKDEVEDDSENNGNVQECLDRPENAVKFVLSWNIWTPLAHLSFGAYLIHPIVIFIWKLGGREKSTFRLLSFLMDFCSITVVTYILSVVAALLVEFPFGSLLSLRSPMLQELLPRRSSKANEHRESLALLGSSSQLYG
jgi:peptidoglycan/LPS O-acetylase OafA/YrhL